jgi:hypothetical protein
MSGFCTRHGDDLLGNNTLYITIYADQRKGGLWIKSLLRIVEPLDFFGG